MTKNMCEWAVCNHCGDCRPLFFTRDAHGNEWNNCQFDGIIILRDTLESGDVTIENEVKGGCQ